MGESAISKVSPLDQANIHSSYGKELVDLLVSRGADQCELLSTAGLDMGLLNLPDGRFTARQLISLVRQGYEITQDPNLGVWYGIQLKISTHGFLGYAALSSATLGEAIELAVKYAKTRLGMVDVNFFMEGDEGVIDVDTLVPVDESLERFFMQTFFSSFAVMGENLIGKLPADITALCSYSEPEIDEELSALFDSDPPEFDQPVNQIRIPKKYLDLPLSMANPVSKQLMEEQCQKELEAIGELDDLLLRVKSIINAEPGRFPKLEEVAEHCYMSSRTLKRRLADMGTSYQELLDRERQKKAVDFLKHTHKTIDEIAILLGYNDPSNFGRAFKRWLGVTPTQYRRRYEKHEN